jgi:hypothetical protein
MQLLTLVIVLAAGLLAALAHVDASEVQNKHGQLLRDKATWVCMARVEVNATLTNTSAPFTVGDCISITDPKRFEKLKEGANMTSRLAKSIVGFPADSFGNFVVDSSCNGLRLRDTVQIKTPPGGGTPGIVCDDDQVAVLRTPQTADNACTIKYANYGEPNREWEQDGLLCYPKCEDGYDGVGPVCWASCQGGSDGGVFCTRETYQPDVSFILPWDDCGANEYQYGIECITNCREGFQKYWALVDYYCASTCPPKTIDAGLTCTKATYGRGAGLIAVPWWELLLIAAAAVIVAVGVIASAGGFAYIAALGTVELGAEYPAAVLAYDAVGSEYWAIGLEATLLL